MLSHRGHSDTIQSVCEISVCRRGVSDCVTRELHRKSFFSIYIFAFQRNHPRNVCIRFFHTENFFFLRGTVKKGVSYCCTVFGARSFLNAYLLTCRAITHASQLRTYLCVMPFFLLSDRRVGFRRRDRALVSNEKETAATARRVGFIITPRFRSRRVCDWPRLRRRRNGRVCFNRG